MTIGQSIPEIIRTETETHDFGSLNKIYILTCTTKACLIQLTLFLAIDFFAPT